MVLKLNLNLCIVLFQRYNCWNRFHHYSHRQVLNSCYKASNNLSRKILLTGCHKNYIICIFLLSLKTTYNWEKNLRINIEMFEPAMVDEGSKLACFKIKQRQMLSRSQVRIWPGTLWVWYQLLRVAMKEWMNETFWWLKYKQS